MASPSALYSEEFVNVIIFLFLSRFKDTDCTDIHTSNHVYLAIRSLNRSDIYLHFKNKNTHPQNTPPSCTAYLLPVITGVTDRCQNCLQSTTAKAADSTCRRRTVLAPEVVGFSYAGLLNLWIGVCVCVCACVCVWGE